MSKIDELNKVPDISFIDGMTTESVEALLKSNYEQRYFELTGEEANLAEGETASMILSAVAVLLGQGFQYVEQAGRQDMLKYSTGAALDNLGALRSIERKPATSATCRLKFTLSEVQTFAVSIAAGTRVRAALKNIFFATSEYAEIPAGELSVEVNATCSTAGVEGNGIEKGGINRLVDTANNAYIDAVENIDITSGGADIESDDDLTLRIYQAPGGYSTAGPEAAYIYHTKAARPDIGDVLVTTPSACNVKVYILMADGGIPPQTVLDEIKGYLNSETIRPLTDNVEVVTPDEIEYKIEADYYIAESDAGLAVSIQKAVTAAVEEYKKWQRKLGRDINPSELIYRMVAAGAKRVELRSPAFKKLQKSELAKLTDAAVEYKGLEEE